SPGLAFSRSFTIMPACASAKALPRLPTTSVRFSSGLPSTFAMIGIPFFEGEKLARVMARPLRLPFFAQPLEPDRGRVQELVEQAPAQGLELLAHLGRQTRRVARDLGFRDARVLFPQLPQGGHHVEPP